jgi:hypothetical protein
MGWWDVVDVVEKGANHVVVVSVDAVFLPAVCLLSALAN